MIPIVGVAHDQGVCVGPVVGLHSYTSIGKIVKSVRNKDGNGVDCNQSVLSALEHGGFHGDLGVVQSHVLVVGVAEGAGQDVGLGGVLAV